MQLYSLSLANKHQYDKFLVSLILKKQTHTKSFVARQSIKKASTEDDDLSTVTEKNEIGLRLKINK